MIHSPWNVRGPRLSARGFAAVEIRPDGGRRRVFLVTLGDDTAFPLMGNSDGFARRELPWIPDLLGALAEGRGMERTLAAEQPNVEDDVYLGRPVEGEVIRDHAGRIFEMLGEHLRPLGRLARTAEGQLVELVPQSRAPIRRRRENYMDAIDAEIEPVERAQSPLDTSDAETKVQREEVEAPAVRKLLNGAGPRRPVRFADFRHLLTPQLAHPERIRESHLLPCRVQVFEAARPMRQEEWGAAVEAENVSAVQPLTAAMVERLKLAHVLPPQLRPRRPMRRIPGTVLPYDRFLALHVEEDPTADRPAAGQGISSAPPAATVTAPAAAAAISYPATQRKMIPENLLRPWEFVRTREEALYDIRISAALRGPLRRLWQALTGWFTGRADRQKWQALLAGKTLDEQLWSVRPPQNSLEHPRVCRWARGTLAQAGYDADSMLLEWQIFWRRTGA